MLPRRPLSVQPGPQHKRTPSTAAKPASKTTESNIQVVLRSRSVSPALSQRATYSLSPATGNSLPPNRINPSSRKRIQSEDIPSLSQIPLPSSLPPLTPLLYHPPPRPTTLEKNAMILRESRFQAEMYSGQKRRRECSLTKLFDHFSRRYSLASIVPYSRTVRRELGKRKSQPTTLFLANFVPFVPPLAQ